MHASFGKYFAAHYVSRTRKWAYCYRKNLGVNTSMYVESFHRTIKRNFLSRKANQRLDVALKALLDFTRHEQFMRLQALVIGETSTKLSATRARHRLSLSLDCFVVIAADADCKTVFFKSANPSRHELRSVKLLEKACECHVRCHECNVCMHTASCNCIDYTIRYNICKHIHFAAREAGRRVCPAPASGNSSSEDACSIIDSLDAVAEDVEVHLQNVCIRSGSSTAAAVQSLLREATQILESIETEAQAKAARECMAKLKAVVRSSSLEDKENFLPSKTKKRRMDVQRRAHAPQESREARDSTDRVTSLSG